MGKYDKSEERVVSVSVPMLKCDFCENEAINQQYLGLTRTWGEVRSITPCGCDNTWIICPDCIRVRLHEIHEIHFKNKS